jgi:plastocyanin
MQRACFVTMVLLSVGCMTTQVIAADWGDLRGQVVYDGDPPKPKAVSITKDKPFCGKHNLVQESLLVNTKNKGIKNVIVFLYLGRGASDSCDVHESYEETAKAEVVLDNDKCRFNPHVVLLRTSQTLKLGNSDPIAHNVKIDTFTNPPINYTLPSGGSMSHQFAKEERLPAQVSCSIHPWMKGWLVIRKHPYMAVTDEDGKFEIKNLPAGEWQFTFWQERAGYLREVKVGDTQTSRRGRANITIRAGDNDLGVIKAGPKLFEQ